MKLIATLALAVAATALATPAMAQFKNTEDAVKYRKAALTVMGNHFARLGAMTSGKAPFDAKVAQDSAHVEELALTASVGRDAAPVGASN